MTLRRRSTVQQAFVGRKPRIRRLPQNYIWSLPDTLSPFVRPDVEKTRRHRRRRKLHGETARPSVYRRRGQRILLLLFCLLLLLIGLLPLRTLLVVRPRTRAVIHLVVGGQPRLELPLAKVRSHPRLIHVVRRNDTFTSIVRRYGLAFAEGEAIHSAVLRLKGEDKEVKALQVGDRLEFVIDGSGSIESLRWVVSTAREYAVRRTAGGEYVARKWEATIEAKERVAVGIVEDSLAAAAAKAGVSYAVVDELVDLFSDRIAFGRDLRKGDRFTVIYRDRVLDNGEVLESGPIMAAAFDIQGKRFVAVRYVGSDGKARYFNENGELVGNTFLRYPLKFSRISSQFSWSRLHPIFKRRRPHLGVDFAAPIGTPVRSVADGRVSYLGSKGANGLMVKVRHSDRYETAYLHLANTAAGLRRGSIVKRGQVIGRVGSSGASTGPHLDFRFWDRGRPVDPLKVKLPTVDNLGAGQRVSRGYFGRVLYTLAHYQEVFFDRPREGLS